MFVVSTVLIRKKWEIAFFKFNGIKEIFKVNRQPVVKLKYTNHVRDQTVCYAWSVTSVDFSVDGILRAIKRKPI